MRKLVYALGRLYPVSPKNLAEGMDVCRVLGRNGITSTLGKFSMFGDDPAHIVDEYRTMSDTLKAAPIGDDFYLSLKPPALKFDLGHVSAIAATALGNGHAIHIDSHEHADTDRTVQLLQDLMNQQMTSDAVRGGWTFGLTLPSRWKRSIEDARWVADRGVRARLVKGEFKADASREVDARKGFLSLVEELIGKVPELALATHDSALVREAVTRCRRGGTPVRLELLFGMPVGALMTLSREMGVPVAFYVPYGETLLVYAIRHLLANPHKLLRGNCLHSLAGKESKLARIVSSV